MLVLVPGDYGMVWPCSWWRLVVGILAVLERERERERERSSPTTYGNHSSQMSKRMGEAQEQPSRQAGTTSPLKQRQGGPAPQS